MKKSAYIFIVAAALIAASCESGIQPDEDIRIDDTVCFLPVLGAAGYAEPAPWTKAAELVSSDGSIAVPLICEVYDTRHDGQDSAFPALQTKGVQLNTTGEWDDLGDYISSFYVSAWSGTSSFVPANTQVSKASPLWKTSTEYSWESTEEATFYAYANLPSSGAVVTSMSSAQVLNYTVPTSASAQNDILFGFYQGKGIFSETLHKGGIAEIKFYHPLTAVRFKQGTFTGTTSFQIKSISIRGVFAGGFASMTPTSMAATEPDKKIIWSTISSTTQTVTMTPSSGTYFTADANGFIGDTFLLIPQTMTTDKPVKISITALVNGTDEKKFEAKLTNNSWVAGKTNVYTLGSN